MLLKVSHAVQCSCCQEDSVFVLLCMQILRAMSAQALLEDSTFCQGADGCCKPQEIAKILLDLCQHQQCHHGQLVVIIQCLSCCVCRSCVFTQHRLSLRHLTKRTWHAGQYQRLPDFFFFIIRLILSASLSRRY